MPWAGRGGGALDLMGTFSYHPYPTIPPDPSTFTDMNIQKPKSSLSKQIGDTQKLSHWITCPLCHLVKKKIIPQTLLQFWKIRGTILKMVSS